MAEAPPCTRLGRQCRALDVTLRVAHLDDGASSGDAEATWLLGHTGRIRFGGLARRADHLYVRARLHVPCRYLSDGDDGRVVCRAHGFEGRLAELPHAPADRRLDGERFEYVERGRLRRGRLAARPAPRRSLAVVASPNPCATARCRTADNTVGAACCRDLQVEILCRPSNRRLEALLRSRKAPYLCKVDREEPDSLGAEMISACSYLDDGGRLCTLHGRVRPDGREAKPPLCSDWPEADATYHGACALRPEQ